VIVRACCSAASNCGRSWTGSVRGGGNCITTGGRQPTGGGVVGGGPAYAAGAGSPYGAGRCRDGVSSAGRRHAASSSGRLVLLVT
jgi:hypothetical protein